MAFVAFNSFQRMVTNKKRAAAGGGGGYGTFTVVPGSSSITYSFSDRSSNVCCSSDGVYVYVSQPSGSNITIYKSADSGSTFSNIYTNSTGIAWFSQLVCDNTGQYIWFSGGNGSTVWYSQNYGVSFTSKTIPTYAPSIGMSSNGLYVMTSGQNVVSYSSNGTSATPTFTAGSQTGAQASNNAGYLSVSSSGQYAYYPNLASAGIMYSSNYGQSYAVFSFSNATVNSTVSCDSTGQYVAVIGNNSTVYNTIHLSTNYTSMAFTLLTTVAGATFTGIKVWINGTKMYIVASGSVNASALYGGCCSVANCTTPASWTWSVLKSDQKYAGIAASSTGNKIYAVGQTSVVIGSVL